MKFVPRDFFGYGTFRRDVKGMTVRVAVILAISGMILILPPAFFLWSYGIITKDLGVTICCP